MDNKTENIMKKHYEEHMKMIKEKGYCDKDKKCRELYKDKIREPEIEEIPF